MRRARLFGCRDSSLMLPQTFSADEVKLVGRNDEDLFGAGERLLQGRRVIEIGMTEVTPRAASSASPAGLRVVAMMRAGGTLLASSRWWITLRPSGPDAPVMRMLLVMGWS